MVNKKKSSVSKTDFETFKFGVERLKEIEKELNSLDTRGFAKEEQDIKARLKKVSEIPYIERQLKSLKLKINKKYRPKKIKSSTGLNKIQKELKKIEKAHETDSEFIKKSAKQKISIDSGVDILVDANFNSFLKDTKKALSDRIEKKEKEIDRFMKMDLEGREAKYRKKQDGLLSDFENEKSKLEKEYREKLKNLAFKKAGMEKQIGRA